MGIALVALAAPAVAHPPPPPPPPYVPKDLIEMGPWLSLPLLQGYYGVEVGPRIALWRLHGDWAFGGEGEAARVWLDQHHQDEIDPSIKGWTWRVGANVRYTWGHAEIEHDLRWEGWAQAGVGVRAIQWDLGGRLLRPDLQLGVGLSQRITSRYSLDSGLLVIVARVGAGGGLPTCAGPCDEPTAPVESDVEIIDHMSFTARW